MPDRNRLRRNTGCASRNAMSVRVNASRSSSTWPQSNQVSSPSWQ
jgi:hypothetical protein